MGEGEEGGAGEDGAGDAVDALGLEGVEEADRGACREALRDINAFAAYFSPVKSDKGGGVGSACLSRPVQRKLVSLLCSQLADPEGRLRAFKGTQPAPAPVLLIPSHLQLRGAWASGRCRSSYSSTRTTPISAPTSGAQCGGAAVSSSGPRCRRKSCVSYFSHSPKVAFA